MTENEVIAYDDILRRPTCTVEQAAKILGTGRSAAYAAAKTGELPTVKIGKRLLVPTALLRRMLGME